MRRWPPVRRAVGLARGLHMSAKHPTCDVHSKGDVDPRRLDVGLWRAGRSEQGIVPGSIWSDRRNTSDSLGCQRRDVGESILTEPAKSEGGFQSGSERDRRVDTQPGLCERKPRGCSIRAVKSGRLGQVVQSSGAAPVSILLKLH